MTKNFFFLIISVFVFNKIFAQLNPAIDVQHYRFAIRLNDSNNIILGQATITIRFKQNADNVWLDLEQKRKDRKGMTVTSVTKNGVDVNFLQDSQHVIIKDAATTGAENIYAINYYGIPADGLIIDTNKYGNRT